MITFNKLFQYMAENNISRKQLSEMTGLTRNQIQTLRNNSTAPLTNIGKICEALKLSPSDIMEYTPEENSTPPFPDQAPSV